MAIVRFFARNLVNICVKEQSNGDFSGELWNQYDMRPSRFVSAMDLMLQMENLYDHWNFPQRSTNCRTFGEQVMQEERTPNQKRIDKMNMHNVQDKRGEKGTFIVQVQYRQNNTWQGQVIWAEENKRVHFRSALELMKMIDGALSGEALMETDQTNEKVV